MTALPACSRFPPKGVHPLQAQASLPSFVKLSNSIPVCLSAYIPVPLPPSLPSSPPGAGKSTLMLALFRLVNISEGRIVIDDVDAAMVSLSQLRRSVRHRHASI